MLAVIQIGRRIYLWDYEFYLGYFAERFSTENYLSVFFWLVTISIGIITVRKKTVYDQGLILG